MKNRNAEDTMVLVDEIVSERKDVFMRNTGNRDKYSVHGLIFAGDEHCTDEYPLEFDIRSTDGINLNFCFLILGKVEYFPCLKLMSQILENINLTTENGSYFIDDRRVFYRFTMLAYSDENLDTALNMCLDKALKELRENSGFLREIARENYSKLIDAYFHKDSYALRELKSKIKQFNS